VTRHVWYSDGPTTAALAPDDALALAGFEPDDTRVTLGWTIERHAWLERADLRGRTVLAGYALRDCVTDGRIVPLPMRLSAVPALIRADPPDLAVVPGIRRDGALAFGSSVGWADELARRADRVVVEVDERVTDLGGPEIPGNIVATTDRPGDAPLAASRPADEVDLRIGALVAGLLPDDPTLQFGPGGIGEGIARAVDRPVHIWSGLVTDAAAEIAERGLLLSPAVAAYTWGGAAIRRLAGDGMLQLTSSTVTHDLSRLSAIPRFVGCNTALEVALDGSVNVERVGGRIVAAVGGHSDFCVGASRSPGGLAVVAVRSRTGRGGSTIVPRVDCVSTQRSDVEVVVTEHGVADLRGVSDATRAERLVSIAAPEHRDELAASSSR
jgi:acyl-CoA hydrolase